MVENFLTGPISPEPRRAVSISDELPDDFFTISYSLEIVAVLDQIRECWELVLGLVEHLVLEWTVKRHHYYKTSSPAPTQGLQAFKRKKSYSYIMQNILKTYFVYQLRMLYMMSGGNYIRCS